MSRSADKYGNRSYIITGNCINEKIMQQAFDIIPRSKSSLALIDPVGYKKLRWTTVKKIASKGMDWDGHKTDLLIFFPLEMAVLRNLTREECQTSIDRLYGNTGWQNIRQDRLEGKIDHNETGKELIDLFKKGLKELNYKYVDDLQPALFSNPPIYHIIWASDRDSRKMRLIISGINRASCPVSCSVKNPMNKIMKKIGITTNVPIEVLIAAGYRPVDLNNIFISDPDPERLIKLAEKDGFPINCCGWIKGIYGVCM